MCSNRGGFAGYTVIEILVAMVSALLTLAAIGGMLRIQGRLFGCEARSLALREASRRVIEMMTKEIRGAGFEPLLSSSFDGRADGIAVARSDLIEIRSDRQGSTSEDPPDGTIDFDSAERVSFFHNQIRQTIYQSVGQQILPLTSVAEVLVSPGGLGLRYFDGCGRELVVPAGGELSSENRIRIRRVALSVTLEDITGTGSISAETTVTLRNRPNDCGETT